MLGLWRAKVVAAGNTYSEDHETLEDGKKWAAEKLASLGHDDAGVRRTRAESCAAISDMDLDVVAQRAEALPGHLCEVAIALDGGDAGTALRQNCGLVARPGPHIEEVWSGFRPRPADCRGSDPHRLGRRYIRRERDHRIRQRSEPG